MATYINDLRLKEIGTGESSGTWGTETNVNLELIGESMGYGTEAIADASTHTITMADGATDGFRCTFLRLTGGGQACTVTLAPNTLSHTWVIRNTTSYALTFTQGSGANVIIAAGLAKMVTTDGLGSAAVVYECLEDLELAGTTTAVTVTASGVITGATVEATGDTSAGDNSAMGYTSAEGLILTGQGSTNDITIKNDADADVITIATGATNVDIVGDVTASTLNADGDTAASDNAAIGYTSAEGLILTGQGSTNDITIKNDADADVLVIPTGTTNVDVVGVATAASFEPDGDTAAGDNAAIGYTSAEGLILTGQGSSTDVTVKNDADATVMSIATGTTQATFAGEVVAASLDISGNIDVDGTTNLDVVDIDGAIQANGTLTIGQDDTGYDVKLFGATAGAYMLWDESADSLLVTSPTSTETQLSLISTDTDANYGPVLKLWRNSASPADGDNVGYIGFVGENSASEAITYAEVVSSLIDVTNATEDGGFSISTMIAGTMRSRMQMTEAETVYNDASLDINHRIESNGNANMLFVDGGSDAVGIGTVPLAASILHVAGHTGSLPTIFEASGAGDGIAVQLKVKANDSTTSTQGLYGNAGSESTDNTIVLGNSGSSGIAVDNGGNVGIGTASPDVELDVDGEIRAADGILFGTDTATANVLDDYEEGTFTPTWTVTGGGSASGGLATNVGRYTKVGRMCTMSWESFIISTSGTITAYRLNLPFQADANCRASGMASEFAQTGYGWKMSVEASGTFVTMTQYDGTAPSANAYVLGSLTYQTV